MTVLPPIRRVRDGAEIEDLCARDQPRSLLVSSPMNEIGTLRSRCWVVGNAGDELGAITAVQVRPDLITASAVLFQPDGAAAIASLVHRSRAQVLSGGADHIAPVVDLLPGASAVTLELLVGPRANIPAGRAGHPGRSSWRDTVRVARPGDVPRLLELYREYPLEAFAPDALPGLLAQLVRQHRIVVAEVDGLVVGAQRIEARSREWELTSGLTVLPPYRGRGIGADILWFTLEQCEAENRGYAGVRAPTNHVFYDQPGSDHGRWIEVRVPTRPTFAKRARRWTRRQVRSGAALVGRSS